MIETVNVSEAVIEQVRTQGAATVKTTSGHAFVFSREMLEQLLEAAKRDEDGLAMLHVNAAVEA